MSDSCHTCCQAGRRHRTPSFEACLGLQQGERQNVGTAADQLPPEVPAKDAAASCIACAADNVGVRLGLLVYEVQDVLGLRGEGHRHTSALDRAQNVRDALAVHASGWRKMDLCRACWPRYPE